jgi:NADPH:quinone reductase-like Zn-dependent oxidoreductase
MAVGAVYTEAGDPAEVVKLIDVAEPRDPGPGQVLVRVTLFPIHWGDLQAIQLASPTGQVRAGVTWWTPDPDFRHALVLRRAGITP